MRFPCPVNTIVCRIGFCHTAHWGSEANYADSQYRELEPVWTGYLIATADNDNIPPGQHYLEVVGWHEAAYLPSGADKETNVSFADQTFTVSGLRATVVEGSIALKTANKEKVRKTHLTVAEDFSIDREGYIYYSYQDVKHISEGTAAPFNGDRNAALSFLEAAFKLEAYAFKVGDMGPGYWISKDGSSAIIGTRLADGSAEAFLIRRFEREDSAFGYYWSEPENL